MSHEQTTTEFLDALHRAGSRQEILDCLSAQLGAYGIGGFGYCYAPMRTARGLEADMNEIHHHHTYPGAWVEALAGDDPLRTDPTATMLLHGRREIDWTAPEAMPEVLPPGARRRYEAALDLGMRFGIDLVLGQDRQGRLLSGAGLWFADRPDMASFRADWTRHAMSLRAILHLFDAMVRGEKAPEMIALSRREQDALCYLAAGFRSAEASWKMRISEKTFEKHVAHAKTKLNARTRDHAIAKALHSGLIEP